jgi:transposase
MVLVRQRTQLKNRIHATLAKYALPCDEVSDLFGTRGRELLRRHLEALPPHTAFATGQLLEQVESLDRQVRAFEQRMHAVFTPTLTIEWLRTLPGVGFILAIVIALEVGDVSRFGCRAAGQLRGHHAAGPSFGREDTLRRPPP